MSFFKWFRSLIERRNLRIASNRNIEDGENKTETSLVVVGVMRYDPDTGELEPLGTWTQPQTFEALVTMLDALNVTLDITCRGLNCQNIAVDTDYAISVGPGDIFAFGLADNAGASELNINDSDGAPIFAVDSNGIVTLYERLQRSGANDIVLRLNDAAGARSVVIQDSGGNPVLSIDSDGNIHLGTGKRIYLDTDDDTALYCAADDDVYIEVAGGNNMRFLNTGNYIHRGINMQNNNIKDSSYIRFSEITKPTAAANKAFIYGKEVGGKAHVMAMDEDGNEFDLTV